MLGGSLTPHQPIESRLTCRSEELVSACIYIYIYYIYIMYIYFILIYLFVHVLIYVDVCIYTSAYIQTDNIPERPPEALGKP